MLDLVGDPTNANRFYASLRFTGIYRSTDGGATWTNISSGNAGLNAALTAATHNNAEMAVAPTTGRLFAAVLQNGQATWIGYSDNPTAALPAWTAMDLPRTQEAAGPIVGLNPSVKPGAQGATHFSIVVDPANANLVYVGGDRQPDLGASPWWPNFVGARDYSGRLFRGTTTVLPTASSPSGRTSPTRTRSPPPRPEARRAGAPPTPTAGRWCSGPTERSSRWTTAGSTGARPPRTTRETGSRSTGTSRSPSSTTCPGTRTPT